MKKSRFSEHQIMQILKQAEGGVPVPELCRQHGMSSEFKKRIKKGRDPLPRLSSCTTGPNGEKVDGHYQLGYERFEPCDDGYVLRERSQGYRAIEGACYRQFCAPSQFQKNSSCQNYTAILRPKPYYVKMWVNGDYLGQYFYQ